MSSSTTAAQQDYRVRDLSLADLGRRAIEVAEKEMPGLMAVREKYAHLKPLAGARIHRILAHDGADRGAD